MGAKFIDKPRIEIILTNTESRKDQIYKESFAPRIVKESGTQSTCNFFVGSKEHGDELLNKLSLDKKKCILDIEKTKQYINEVEIKFLDKLNIDKFYGKLKGFYEAKKQIMIVTENVELIGFKASFSKNDDQKRSRIMIDRNHNKNMDLFRELLIGIVSNIVIEMDNDVNIFYPEIKSDLERSITDDFQYDNASQVISQDMIGYNKIFYGIPGCGKSYYIEHTILKNVDKENNVFRTTFYLDYSNSDFIGQIYPSTDQEGNVFYKRNPGPFTRALARAYELKNMDSTENVFLVIEEINRANAAAVFGDLFQLLDRLEKPWSGRNIGDSEYPISNEFIEGYFLEKNISYIPGQIYIPSNLIILATMNTSDQNVFPLDTAFKRRWDRERVEASMNDCEFANMFIPFTDLTWKVFVKGINDKIARDSNDGTILEDKKLGPFFAKKDMFIEESNKYIKSNNVSLEDKKKYNRNLNKFIYNVIDYLYNDVCKFDHEYLFEPNVSFDDICKVAKECYLANDQMSSSLFIQKSIFGLDNESEDSVELIGEITTDEEE